MLFHLVSSLAPCGNTAQLRVRARSLAREEGEAHIFTFQPVLPVVREAFEGIARIHELNTHFAPEPFWRIQFTARKLRLKPREIHVWGTELLSTGLRLARYYKVPSVATLRHPDAFQTRFPVLRRFSRIETNSSFLRDAAIQAGNRGNWQVIPDLLDDLPLGKAKTSAKTRAEFLAELELPEDSVLMACVGPISRWKRWQWAVWSIDSIVRVHPESRLLLFDPDLENPRSRRLNPLAERERRSVTDFIRQYERENIVRILPFRTDFQEILPFVNYFWNLQTVPGSSLAALEAMRAGIPVIAHRAGLNADLFPDGSFMQLPEEPETLSLASATHLLWIHPEQREEQINFALENLKKR